VVNAASGRVGRNAAAEVERLVQDFGLRVHVVNVPPRRIAAAVRKAVDADPDLVVVLAGDGTAALAARLAGPEGPLVAPLPGGTMNMLPHALYGQADWRHALVAALDQGCERSVSCGEVEGRTFYVAAILGAQALWAGAREAFRAGRIGVAVARARRALSRAFSHELQYRLEDAAPEKTEALMLMCPLISHGRVGPGALEAAALDPHDVAELLRLGLNTALGRWRQDPSVKTTTCAAGTASARRRIPAVLDGELCRLDPSVRFSFRPAAFRALAPPNGGSLSPPQALREPAPPGEPLDPGPLDPIKGDRWIQPPANLAFLRARGA
jgi:diacylglycerol kinase family enzyme